VQANDILGESKDLTTAEQQLQLALKIISYFYMGVLVLLFTFRYVRELIAVAKKKPLTVWINWMESLVFLTYFVYSMFTSITHIVYSVRHYNHSKEEEELHPELFVGKNLEATMAVEILEIFVHMYIIADKGTHYLHAGHSVSLFLAKAQHIPKNAHPGHDEEHAHHDVLENHYADNDEEEIEEKDDEEYDDYVGRITTGPTRATTVRRHSSLIDNPNTANFDSEIKLHDRSRDRAFDQL